MEEWSEQGDDTPSVQHQPTTLSLAIGMVPGAATGCKLAIFCFCVFPAIPRSASTSLLKYLLPEQGATPQKSEFQVLRATLQAFKF